jgi:hypothetical protein
MGAGEVLGGEAARLQQGDGQRIAHRQAAVVLEVGARFSGQASFSTPHRD